MKKLIGYQVLDTNGNAVNGLSPSLVLTMETANEYWFGSKSPHENDGRRRIDIFEGDIKRPILEAQSIKNALVSENDIEKFISYMSKDEHNRPIKKKGVLKSITRSTVHTDYDLAVLFNGRGTVLSLLSEIIEVHNT